MLFTLYGGSVKIISTLISSNLFKNFTTSLLIILYFPSIPFKSLILCFIISIALKLLSTKCTDLHPLLKDSIPKEPVPENKSNTFEFTMSLPKTLKILSLTLSRVGRILKSDGAFNLLPLYIPEIILIVNHHPVIYSIENVYGYKGCPPS